MYRTDPLLSCKIWILLSATVAPWANICNSVLWVPSWKLWRAIDLFVLQRNNSLLHPLSLDVHCCPCEMLVCALPIPLNWLNQRPVALPTGKSHSCLRQILCSIVQCICFRSSTVTISHCALSGKAALCRLIAVLAVLTSAQSVSCMRLKYAPKDICMRVRKTCEMMNTLQKISSLTMKVITPEN